MVDLKKVPSNQMDTDTRSLLRNNRLVKNKKRVIVTLFLYLFLFILACDFKSPEAWEIPGLYTSLTIALVNNEYSFGELVDSTTILSNDSDVIRVEYPVDIDTLGIADSYFDIIMPAQVDIPDLGFVGTPIPLPPLIIDLPLSMDISSIIDEIVAVESGFPEGTDCFPVALAPDIDIPWAFDYPINYTAGNSFFQSFY